MSACSTIRRGVALLAALALVVALPALPASATSPTACRVKNLDTGITKWTLQKAVRAASPDDRLTVRGTCFGVTTIGTSLRVTGIRTRTSGNERFQLDP